jgi:hypothetical protein
MFSEEYLNITSSPRALALLVTHRTPLVQPRAHHRLAAGRMSVSQTRIIGSNSQRDLPAQPLVGVGVARRESVPTVCAGGVDNVSA